MLGRSSAASALGLVLGLDVLRSRSSFGLLMDGATDELAHLATALIALLAVVPRPWLVSARGSCLWVLAGAVAIDVDHLPLYSGVPQVADGGRPFSHSLLTVLVLLSAASARRVRLPAAGAAAGVLLHLLRDLATGPGAPLLWPLDGDDVRLPYAAYAGVIGALALLASVRRRHRDGGG